MNRSQEIIRTSWIGIIVNELLGTSISADFAKQIIKEVSDFDGVPAKVIKKIEIKDR